MVGITGAQTLQLNLVAFPPDPCLTVSLGFQNRNGVAVGPSQTTLTLQPGQSVSLALNGASLVAADQRVELLPTVAGFDGAATGASCVASVEVINNANGVTRVLVPGAIGYPPTPGLWHVGRDVCSDGAFERGGVSSDPCTGTISLCDKNGTQIGSSLGSSTQPRVKPRTWTCRGAAL